MKLGHIVATQENLNEEVVVASETPVEAQENETELADAGTELAQDEQAVEQTDSAVEQAEESVDALEEAQAALGAPQEGEEVSPEQEAALQEPATETEIATTECLLSSIHSTLGIKDYRPSLESYGKQSRKQLIATLEDNKQGLMSKIGTGIKAIINTIVGFIAGLFRNKTLMLKYIKNLEEKAKTAEFKTGKVAAKFKDMQQASKALGATRTLISFANDRITALEAYKEDLKKNAEFDEKAIADKLRVEIPSEMAVTVFAGGSKITTKDSDGMVSGINVENGEASITEGEALSQSEAMSLLKDAEASLKMLDEVKKTESRILKVGRDFMDGFSMGWNMKKAQSNLNKGDLDSAQESANKAGKRGGMLIFRGAAVTAGHRLPALIFKNIKASADYVKASMGSSEKAE